MGAAGEIWNRQFSHAQENIRIVRGSLLTKDKTYIFLYRADALEPAEALLLRLLPAAWLNTLCTPGARQKGRFVTLACKKLFFCLAYEVKPRNRPHISSLSTECGTGALEARRVRMWGRRVKSGTVSSAMRKNLYRTSVEACLLRMYCANSYIGRTPLSRRKPCF